MNITGTLSIIKTAAQTESRHFLEQCEDRNLNPIQIHRIIKKKEILGIPQQDQNLFKVWFHYNYYKDLNVIIKILSHEKIKLITVFLSYSIRRKK